MSPADQPVTGLTDKLLAAGLRQAVEDYRADLARTNLSEKSQREHGRIVSEFVGWLTSADWKHPAWRQYNADVEDG